MQRQTKLDLLSHCLSTVILSLFLYATYHDVTYIGVAIAGCIFIDIDHFVDYFRHYKMKVDPAAFLRHEYLKSGKVYLYFHSWEVVSLIYCAAFLFDSRIAFILAASLSIHLAIDNVQRRRPFFYFLLYRLYKRFDARYLLPEYFEAASE
jgi:hypothetical protein